MRWSKKADLPRTYEEGFADACAESHQPRSDFQFKTRTTGHGPVLCLETRPGDGKVVTGSIGGTPLRGTVTGWWHKAFKLSCPLKVQKTPWGAQITWNKFLWNSCKREVASWTAHYKAKYDVMARWHKRQQLHDSALFMR